MVADSALIGRERVTRCRIEARSSRAMEKYGILDKVKEQPGFTHKGSTRQYLSSPILATYPEYPSTEAFQTLGLSD
jgi:hypothetical protein